MTTERVAGRLVLADAVVPGRLTIEDGRIAAIEPDDAEAGGPIVAPGFIDLHVHGWGGHDATGDAAELSGMARALLRHGVTSFLPTAPSLAEAELPRFADRVRAWMPDAPDDGAQPLGFNLEGPFLAPARKGAHDPALLRTPADVGADAIAPLLVGLRVMTLAPELPGALALIERLAGLGIAVSLGHSQSTLEEARAGYLAGGRSTTHLFNAMSGVDHRNPGLAVAALTDDDAYVELIADGHHVHPALWPIVTRTKPADRLLLVSDALPLAGVGDGRTTIGGLRVVVRRRALHARGVRDARRVGDRARHGGPEPGPRGHAAAGGGRGGVLEPGGAPARGRSRSHRGRAAGAPGRARRRAARPARHPGLWLGGRRRLTDPGTRASACRAGAAQPVIAQRPLRRADRRRRTPAVPSGGSACRQPAP